MTAEQVSNAIQSQNQTFGIGQIGAPPMRGSVDQSFVVTAQGLLTKPENSRTSSSVPPSRARRLSA